MFLVFFLVPLRSDHPVSRAEAVTEDAVFEKPATQSFETRSFTTDLGTILSWFKFQLKTSRD